MREEVIWLDIADVLSPDVEQAQLFEIIDEVMTHLYTVFGLVKCILVTMDLGQNSTELHLESCDDNHLTHAVANRTILQAEIIS